MRLVSEQSEAQLQAYEARTNLKHALRRLTANLMRVTRGAGSSDQLAEQMVDCIEAMDSYGDATGNGVPSWDLDQMLDPEQAQSEFRPLVKRDEASLARWEADGTLDRDLAERDIRRASLQVIASMLVNQTPQQTRGETDFS